MAARSSWHEVYLHISRTCFPLAAKYSSTQLAVCTPNSETLWIISQRCPSEAAQEDEGRHKEESQMKVRGKCPEHAGNKQLCRRELWGPEQESS